MVFRHDVSVHYGAEISSFSIKCAVSFVFPFPLFTNIHTSELK